MKGIAMAVERIEAVKKVSEAFNSPQTNATSATDPNAKSQFQTYVDSSKQIQNFQPLNTNSLNQTQIQPEATHQAAQNPIFAEENTSAQKNRDGTEQDQKKRRQSEETEAVTATSTVREKAQSNSLIQEMQKLNTQVSKAKRLSPEDLRQQAKGMIAQIEQVKTQLAQPSTDIKPSYQTVLRNRLTHIDDNLKIALSKAGVEYTPPVEPTGSKSTNPIQRFIGMLSSSQYQLEHLNQTIEQLSLTNASLTPANMLALQMKMGYVQQQMELFTSLLNKSLESTKTIMNVQV